MWEKIKKLWFSMVGKPYLRSTTELVDGKIELGLDYNTAFIRYLDRHGYEEITDPQEKIQVYLSNLYAEAEEEVEGEEYLGQ
jgi:hypothetical protein